MEFYHMFMFLDLDAKKDEVYTRCTKKVQWKNMNSP